MFIVSECSCCGITGQLIRVYHGADHGPHCPGLEQGDPWHPGAEQAGGQPCSTARLPRLQAAQVQPGPTAARGKVSVLSEDPASREVPECHA